MNIYILSDTHLFHENIKKYEGRPDNFNELIIKNWCKVVKPEDLVIHLGDVIFGMDKQKNLTSILASLPGKKVLTRGNHDSYPTAKWGDWKWFMECGFDMVVDYFVYDRYAFSHCPLTPLPNQANLNYAKQVEKNFHGHFHRGHTRLPQPGEDENKFKDDFYDYQYYRKNKERYRLIQIEDELRLFSLEEVLNEKN